MKYKKMTLYLGTIAVVSTSSLTLVACSNKPNTGTTAPDRWELEQWLNNPMNLFVNGPFETIEVLDAAITHNKPLLAEDLQKRIGGDIRVQNLPLNIALFYSLSEIESHFDFPKRYSLLISARGEPNGVTVSKSFEISSSDLYLSVINVESTRILSLLNGGKIATNVNNAANIYPSKHILNKDTAPFDIGTITKGATVEFNQWVDGANNERGELKIEVVVLDQKGARSTFSVILTGFKNVVTAQQHLNEYMSNTLAFANPELTIEKLMSFQNENATLDSATSVQLGLSTGVVPEEAQLKYTLVRKYVNPIGKVEFDLKISTQHEILQPVSKTFRLISTDETSPIDLDYIHHIMNNFNNASGLESRTLNELDNIQKSGIVDTDFIYRVGIKNVTIPEELHDVQIKYTLERLEYTKNEPFKYLLSLIFTKGVTEDTLVLHLSSINVPRPGYALGYLVDEKLASKNKIIARSSQIPSNQLGVWVDQSEAGAILGVDFSDVIIPNQWVRYKISAHYDVGSYKTYYLSVKFLDHDSSYEHYLNTVFYYANDDLAKLIDSYYSIVDTPLTTKLSASEIDALLTSTNSRESNFRRFNDIFQTNLSIPDHLNNLYLSLSVSKDNTHSWQLKSGSSYSIRISYDPPGDLNFTFWLDTMKLYSSDYEVNYIEDQLDSFDRILNETAFRGYTDGIEERTQISYDVFWDKVQLKVNDSTFVAAGWEISETYLKSILSGNINLGFNLGLNDGVTSDVKFYSKNEINSTSTSATIDFVVTCGKYKKIITKTFTKNKDTINEHINESATYIKRVLNADDNNNVVSESGYSKQVSDFSTKILGASQIHEVLYDRLKILYDIDFYNSIDKNSAIWMNLSYSEIEVTWRQSGTLTLRLSNLNTYVTSLSFTVDYDPLLSNSSVQIATKRMKEFLKINTNNTSIKSLQSESELPSDFQGQMRGSLLSNKIFNEFVDSNSTNKIKFNSVTLKYLFYSESAVLNNVNITFSWTKATKELIVVLSSEGQQSTTLTLNVIPYIENTESAISVAKERIKQSFGDIWNGDRGTLNVYNSINKLPGNDGFFRHDGGIEKEFTVRISSFENRLWFKDNRIKGLDPVSIDYVDVANISYTTYFDRATKTVKIYINRINAQTSQLALTLDIVEQTTTEEDAIFGVDLIADAYKEMIGIVGDQERVQGRIIGKAIETSFSGEHDHNWDWTWGTYFTLEDNDGVTDAVSITNKKSSYLPAWYSQDFIKAYNVSTNWVWNFDTSTITVTFRHNVYTNILKSINIEITP